MPSLRRTLQVSGYSGAEPELVAETFSLMAAALLTEAFGGDAGKAAALARKVCSERVGRYARHAA